MHWVASISSTYAQENNEHECTVKKMDNMMVTSFP